MRSPSRLSLALLFLVALAALAPAQPAADGPAALERRVLAEAEKGSEILANLTYLCDVIGPRLTGSANLKRANDWAADKMKAYGLTNVHHEAWSLPEGWERGPAQARIVEPENGVRIALASMAWYAGTEGPVRGPVVAFDGSDMTKLAEYKGKLKGAIILSGKPVELVSIDDLHKTTSNIVSGSRGFPAARSGDFLAARKAREEFLQQEGVAAVLLDSQKHFGLLNMTGSWQGKDRASAGPRLPTFFVAHQHYELLHRLASRPGPAKTILELDAKNRFIPGPLPVYNTIGEIKGSDKPDEVVVVGAHLDSWDLGQGAVDNGTGSMIVLETARILARSGIQPRRTIRFILFTGEEQGLIGSKAYVEKHKDELPRISACIVHDTGTGKCIGIASGMTGALKQLEAEIPALRTLGVTEFQPRPIQGSDHNSFERAGVPGLCFKQENAGYRFAHHSQVDTLDRADLAALRQGAQAMAVTALHIANRPDLLKRGSDTTKTARRFELDDLGKLVDLADPQIAPDGKSISLVVARPNYEKNRRDAELVLVDVASGKHRVLTRDRHAVGQPRWSPKGDRLAFLASAVVGKHTHMQVFVLPMNGGEAQRITEAPAGVRHFSWKPDGSAIAFAAPEEPANKDDIEKGNDAFEVGNNDFLTREGAQPVHVWLVPADGGKARRLTSGAWGLTTVPPPGPPASPLSWSPDGKTLLIVRQELPHDGDNDRTTVHVLEVASGKLKQISERKSLESFPAYSPDGKQIAYWYPRDGDPNNVNEVWVGPAAGESSSCLTQALDRCLYHSVWMPDSQALLVGGHDGTHVALWQQPLTGKAQKLDLGRICPTWFYQMDANVGRDGAIAFTGTEPDHPTELYYLSSPTAKPRRLTDFNAEVAGRALGKVETIAWNTRDNFPADGILTYPPGFEPTQKYPLVLVIHGGPQSASVERFSALPQLLAARGNVVFEPNYRGSDHLGNAYMRAIVNDWGKGPGEDVMAGLDTVKQRGFVDEQRIAVTGWSYGGYMTSWLIAHYHVWKTAIAGAAVTDWADQYNLGDGNVQGRYLFGGSPWTGDYEQHYRRHSPITYARSVKTPTLILATTGDARVPITQSYRLYHALRDNNVPVRFIAYPVAGHFPGDPVRQKDLYRRWAEWLGEQLR